jgi:hypothetical protein
MEGDWHFIVRALGKTLGESEPGGLGQTNFKALISWAKQHRILNHIQNQLRIHAGSPEQIEELKREISTHQRASLKKLSLLFRILKQFESEQIECLVLKGEPLSQSLYGDASRRMVTDIDLLVAPSNFEAACKSLQALNLKPLGNSFLSTDLRSSKLYRSDRGFLDESSKTRVELHFRLMHPSYLHLPLKIEEILMQKDFVEIQGRKVPVLSTELNFIYLCAHGHKHAWERLDWLYDFICFHRKYLNGRVSSAIELARRFDQLREMRSAFQLAYDFFKPAYLAHQEIPLDSTRAFRKLRSDVIQFQHFRVQQINIGTSKKIKFWKRNSFAKQRGFFNYFTHFQYEAWLARKKPMRSYYVWMLAQAPSLMIRRLKGQAS